VKLLEMISAVDELAGELALVGPLVVLALTGALDRVALASAESVGKKAARASMTSSCASR